MRRVHAAGGVIWRPTAKGIEVTLVHRPRRRDWSLPKGKLEPGEPTLVAACREVWEETGVRAAPQNHLARLRYRVPVHGGHAEKFVDYWAMRPLSAEEFTPNDEVDGIEWVSPDRAVEMLTYAHDARLMEMFAGQPRVTSVVALYSPPRRGNAKTIDVLASLQPEKVISTDSSHYGVVAEALAARTAAKPGHDRRVTWDKVRRYATRHPSTVVCAPGDEVDSVLRSLADVDGVTIPARAAGHDKVWVLCFRADALLSVDVVGGA